MLELFHWEPNGSALKALIVLHEKRLPFQSHYVDLLAIDPPPRGVPDPIRETRFNPEGEGPVLVHEGRQVSESFFLIEYLEDTFPETPLRPPDALSHARILAWGRFDNEVFTPGVNTLGCHRYLAPLLKGHSAEAVERFLSRISARHLQEGWRMAFADAYSADLLEDSERKVGIAVRRIEDTLATSPWLAGSTYSLADIDAFALCNSLPGLTPRLVNDKDTPRLLQWLHRIRERPAVREALAMSRTSRPEEAFVPGPEHSRWG